MLVACPGCNKKLNVPESASGKKVRCPGCKAVVAVPDRTAAAAPSPPREAVRAGAAKAEAPSAEAVAAAPASAMRCPACQTAALRELPPNAFSRHPGYVCSGCNAIMRPPGSTGTYVFVIILGGFIVLLGVVQCVIAFDAEVFRKRLVFGAVSLAGLGAAVVGWAVMQLRLPTPLDAPARPSRLGLWIVILLLGLLVVGGGMFFFMYLLHEMM